MNRAKLTPSNNITEYRITSDMIKQFVALKVSHACPDATSVCVPNYFEVKGSNPRRSFAYLTLALSENVLEKSNDHAWLNGLIGNSENLKVVPSIWKYIIGRFMYDGDDLREKRKNPKYMDIVNDNLGMSDSDFDYLISLCKPRASESKQDGKRWLLFAAGADKIIENMLEDRETNKLPGSLHIVEIIPISKDNVEFVCHIYDTETTIQYNTEIKDILGR